MGCRPELTCGCGGVPRPCTGAVHLTLMPPSAPDAVPFVEGLVQAVRALLSLRTPTLLGTVLQERIPIRVPGAHRFDDTDLFGHLKSDRWIRPGLFILPDDIHAALPLPRGLRIHRGFEAAAAEVQDLRNAIDHLAALLRRVSWGRRAGPCCVTVAPDPELCHERSMGWLHLAADSLVSLWKAGTTPWFAGLGYGLPMALHWQAAPGYRLCDLVDGDPPCSGGPGASQGSGAGCREAPKGAPAEGECPPDGVMARAELALAEGDEGQWKEFHDQIRTTGLDRHRYVDTVIRRHAVAAQWEVWRSLGGPVAAHHHQTWHRRWRPRSTDDSEAEGRTPPSVRGLLMELGLDWDEVRRQLACGRLANWDDPNDQHDLSRLMRKLKEHNRVHPTAFSRHLASLFSAIQTPGDYVAGTPLRVASAAEAVYVLQACMTLLVFPERFAPRAPVDTQRAEPDRLRILGSVSSALQSILRWNGGDVELTLRHRARFLLAVTLRAEAIHSEARPAAPRSSALLSSPGGDPLPQGNLDANRLHEATVQGLRERGERDVAGILEHHWERASHAGFAPGRRLAALWDYIHMVPTDARSGGQRSRHEDDRGVPDACTEEAESMPTAPPDPSGCFELGQWCSGAAHSDAGNTTSNAVSPNPPLPQAPTNHVFINVPYDLPYLPYLDALVVLCRWYGVGTRLAADEPLERGSTRLNHINKMVLDCTGSIHALSRNLGNVTTRAGRMNMPLELGLAMHVSNEGNDGEGRTGHEVLILARAGARINEYVSDLDDVKERVRPYAGMTQFVDAVGSWVAQLQERNDKPGRVDVDKARWRYRRLMDDALALPSSHGPEPYAFGKQEERWQNATSAWSRDP